MLRWLGGSKGKKRCKMTKNSVHHALYLRDHTSYDLHSWYTFVKGQYLPVFFVFQISIFRVVSRLKMQKVAQNDKKSCLSYSISQEAYIIWSRFLVHMSKMISPDVFFILMWILIFWVVRRVKGQKLPPKWQKNISLHILGAVPHMIVVFGTRVKWYDP